jgi:hypothetical protein
MAKDALFFSHDLNARNDKKISALVREFKSAGYGIFWCAVEMMHEEGGKLELDELTICAIAKDLNEDIELVEKVISKCIIVKLFQGIDNNNLISNRVSNNLTHRESISKIRSEAGRNGAKAKQMLAKAKQMPDNCQANAQQNEAIAEQSLAKKERKKERDNTTTEEPPEILEKTELGSEVVMGAAKQAWDDQKWREQICLANYFKPEDLKQWMYMYNASLTGDTDLHGFNVSKYKKMFNGWLQSKIAKGYKLPEKPRAPATNGLRTLTSE